MIRFGRLVAEHRILVLVLAVLLLIPAVLGNFATRINYDILTYLPDEIDTMQGQDILMEQFGKGGFSMVVVEGMTDQDVADLGEKIKKVDGVADVLSYGSVAGTSIPKEFLSKDLQEKFQNGDSSLMLVFPDQIGDEVKETITFSKPIVSNDVRLYQRIGAWIYKWLKKQ
jgi:predicted RND superfamily exporter protein